MPCSGCVVWGASSVVPTPPAQGLALPPWETFPPGVPHPEDWHALPPRATDALIDQPAGRYLFVRLRLVGDGRATPVVRRVHIDFPRNTSADLLPTVYREEPDSADFTERFVSLFDAALAEASIAVEKFPALLDPEGVPNEVLPWIGQLLGLVFDPGWEPDRQRKLLAAAPSLFRRLRRGSGDRGARGPARLGRDPDAGRGSSLRGAIAPDPALRSRASPVDSGPLGTGPKPDPKLRRSGQRPTRRRGIPLQGRRPPR